MKAFTRLVSIVALFWATTLFGQGYPARVAHVSDHAKVLAADAAQALDSELALFEAKAGVDIAVVTVDTIGGTAIEAYAKGLGESWGVGGKTDGRKGVVFLVAVKDRLVRIQTTAAARGVLTDSAAAAIQADAILPRFRAEKMPQGIVEGARAMMAAFNAPASANRSNGGAGATEASLVLGIIAMGVSIFVIALIVSARRDARRLVLTHRKEFSERVGDLERKLKHPIMKDKAELRKTVSEARAFALFLDGLSVSTKVKWVDTQRSLETWQWNLNPVEWEIDRMLNRLAQAEKSIPQLLERLPVALKGAEDALAAGGGDEDRRRRLERARSQVSEAQGMYVGGMDPVNLLLVYALLESAQSHAAPATAGSHSSSSDGSISTMDSSSISTPSADMGGSFDGGGGASGSW
ncbi:MAG TPA: TPM domain-containing protein [Candidatus Paceibacterota bacterium]|jgi:uncharacterized membrane protein YgcG|nr:TPM domain-containing protein [Candidatus Paceibacterota bacterium]